MSTPKRRKQNTFKPSSQTVGSLDFFFGKQRTAEKTPKQQDHERAVTEPQHALRLQDASVRMLDDEDVARRLQSQWEEEDRANGGSTAEVGNPGSDVGVAGDDVEGHKKAPAKEESAEGAPVPNSYTPSGHIDDHPPKPERNKADILSLQSAASSQDTVSSTIPFDENPLLFDPSKYLPALRLCWAKEGGDVSYGLLTRCFVLVNSTQSRIKIVDTLVNFLRIIIEGSPESLLPSVRFPAEIPRWCCIAEGSR